ncbi:MAG TPA: YCF48-related protein, partial [Bacteroidales bacterium]|nr:YCF48-related protein [Bacteroidales bacterium]
MNKAVFKILLFIIFLQVQTYCFAQGSWEQIEVPTQQFLRSVYFTDSLTGWAVGDSGIIVHTMDGGGNWMIQESNTANDIVDVFFLNSQLGWASSFNYSTPPYGTLLLKTTNGGIDWIGETYPVENIFMTCIFFLDSLVGWMGGIPHA